jgi:hypothetical protein
VKTREQIQTRKKMTNFAEPAVACKAEPRFGGSVSLTWDLGGLAVAFVGLGLLMLKHRHFFHDDAYISLRYARNLAEHGVLEWNLGERAEGYTNFLHVVLTAALLKAGVSPEAAVQGIGVVSATVLILALFFALKRLAPEAEVLRACLVVAAGTSPGVAIWVMGGLETVMLAALLASGAGFVIASLQDNRTAYALAAGLCFSVAVLTRMDSAVYIGATAITVLFGASGYFRTRFLRSALIGGLPATVALAHMAWRISHYGLPMPLTFYAKADLPIEMRLQFLNDISTYVVFALPIWFIALVSAGAALVPKGQDRPVLLALALPFLASSAYVVWSGGDHMPGARVILPLVGPSVLIVAAQYHQRHALAPLMLAASLCAALFAHVERKDGAAFYGTVVADHINRNWEPGMTIALSTAGSTPFHANQHKYIDMLGLNDPHIAQRKDIPLVTSGQTLPGHGKGDGAYVLSREPDVIILGPANGKRSGDPSFLSDWELARSPDFARCYEMMEDILVIPPEQASQVRDGKPKVPFTWYRRTCSKTN